jgi:uncharacterized protein YraI
MTRHPIRTVLVALLAVALLATAGLATAQTTTTTDPSVFSVFGDGEDDGLLADGLATARKAAASASAFGDRLDFWASEVSPLGDPPGPTAEETASSLQTYVNERSGTFVGYINNQTGDSVAWSEKDVLRVEFTDAAGNTATRYVILNATNGTVQSLEVTENTSRTVDVVVEVDDYGTAEAEQTVRSLYEEYVSTGTLPDGERRSELTAKYGGEIEITGASEG